MEDFENFPLISDEIASRIIDLPDPVSPVITVSPGLKSILISSIIAKSLYLFYLSFPIELKYNSQKMHLKLVQLYLQLYQNHWHLLHIQ